MREVPRARVLYLICNQAWVMEWDGDIIPILDKRFFETREAIETALRDVGLCTDAHDEISALVGA